MECTICSVCTGDVHLESGTVDGSWHNTLSAAALIPMFKFGYKKNWYHTKIAFLSQWLAVAGDEFLQRLVQYSFHLLDINIYWIACIPTSYQWIGWMVCHALRTDDCAPSLRDDYWLFVIFITHNNSRMENSVCLGSECVCRCLLAANCYHRGWRWHTSKK